MALKRLLHMKVLGRHEDADADVELTEDDDLGWRALVTVQPAERKLTHKTAWFEGERDALAAAATWMHSQFLAAVTCVGTVVAISAVKNAA